MSIHIYTDESWFPDHAIQTLAIIRWSAAHCTQLRTNIDAILAIHNCFGMKRSKIRAKKRFFHCAQQIIEEIDTWKRHSNERWVCLYTWWNVMDLYHLFFADMSQKGHTDFSFFPDKNLTLKWHTKQHAFTWDDRFVQVTPVLARHESLIIGADLLAGMYREAHERPEVFKKDMLSSAYLPDVYKVALWSSRNKMTKATVIN